ncbi:pantoate--beta-alanine ligase [Fontisphaera persica]|uniref:pantoate--beta-alanine ligase n=1 Tax=Fontisphaera persica TaxID=2974023 RepID=UPI0024C05068|nr:pantoate--beta-alanine ligase [Fontisphaera persica]WCJ61030.1 pantoate--beta-alanine ligase [Fontisphaera persica]
MRVIQSLQAMQRQALKWRAERRTIGFVPTMGYLHEGHLSLVRRARRAVGPNGVVVVSIYVNPTQFGPQEDLARYPRDLPRDLQLCRGAGVDVVFTPSDEAMYPGRATGDYSTYVVEEQLSRGMEGASRPTHFRGVTTVVAKLFLLVQPHVAVFGEKDYQQAAIIRRMTRDLNFPLRIVVAPTCREADGLAMSSRNKYLTPEQRQQAVCLYRALCHAREIVRQAPHPVDAHQLRIKLRQEIEARPEARVDYIEFFDPDTLRPQARVMPGHRMALAVWVGTTRLIDNAAL